ncbi:hypothetical protein R6Q57_013562 [Mikania cordata]
MAGSENEPANSSSSGESEESLSESEPDKASTPPSSSKKMQLTSKSASNESGSQSESDTEKSLDKPQSPNARIKPLALQATDDDQSKKPRSKNPTSRYSPPPVTGKRPAEEGVDGDVKRIKKTTVVAVAAPDADNFGEKKQLFQRLWSEDNEFELIQGMIDYVEEKGKDPLADVNDFHEFVKKSLHVDVNDRQVLTKARRLKKKFENNAARVESKGKVRSFSNPHEKKIYELSKNLWGKDGNKNAVINACSKKVKVKVNVTSKTNKSSKSVGSSNGNVGIEENANEVEPKVVQPLLSSHGLDHLGLMGLPMTDEVIMNKGLELLSGPKKVEMEEKWKNLKVLELELFLKKVNVLKEQAEVVLNAIAKSGAK